MKNSGNTFLVALVIILIALLFYLSHKFERVDFEPKIIYGHPQFVFTEPISK